MRAERRFETVPAVGAGLEVEGYLEFLAKEYLAGFVRHGGAAVKVVVVGDDDVARRFHAGLAADAAGEGFVYAAVDAATTRAHLADQLFFAIAAQVDWTALASRAVRAAYDAAAFPAPEPPGDLTVAAVAAHYEVDARELYRSVRRALEHALLGATELAHEFRLAMLRLCQAELGVGEVDVAERDAVLSWLRGEKVALALLRRSLIYGRIGRHSAQAMLTSLSSWLARLGHGGLVLDIDLARLAVGRRPPVEQREGVYYSKAAVLDAYEVVRQLIDATDVLSAAMVVVVVSPELLTDEVRGLPAYSALHLRVADEVRDRRLPNPYAGLVRLETRLEAVAAR
jgi:hypothetical protein